MAVTFSRRRVYRSIRGRLKGTATEERDTHPKIVLDSYEARRQVALMRSARIGFCVFAGVLGLIAGRLWHETHLAIHQKADSPPPIFLSETLPPEEPLSRKMTHIQAMTNVQAQASKLMDLYAEDPEELLRAIDGLEGELRMAPKLIGRSPSSALPLLPTPGRSFGGIGISGGVSLESAAADAIDRLSKNDPRAVFPWLAKMTASFDDDFFQQQLAACLDRWAAKEPEAARKWFVSVGKESRERWLTAWDPETPIRP